MPLRYIFLRSLFFICLLALSAFSSAIAAPVLQYEIKGIQKPLLENAIVRLKAAEQRAAQPLDKATIKSLFANGPQQIRLALQPFGYFNPQITSKIQHTDDTWLAQYWVKPGAPVIIQEINIDLSGAGANNPTLKQVFKKFPVKPGQVLNTETYETAKRDFLAAAESIGFLSAEVMHSEVKIDLNNHRAYINLKLDTGHQYYFGSVLFQKNPYSEKFLRRYVNFKPGQPYNGEDILKLQETLNSSPYFSQVIITPEREMAKDYIVPLSVQLVPRKPQRYDFGLGYGTDTGIRGILGMEMRQLTKTGERFSANLRASEVMQNLTASYIIPGKHPATDQYSVNGSITDAQYGKETTSTLYQTGAAYISQIKGWQQTIQLNYQTEEYELTDDSPNKTSRLLIPSISWSRMQADNLLYPMQGYRVSLNLKASPGQFLSDTRFTQTTLEGKYIQRILKADRVLLRGQFGYTVADDSNLLPPSLRFYSGGSKSVRGYDYQGLGPGRYLTEVSIEYQHSLKKNWNAAIFYDAGNAYNHFNEKLMQGIGLGIVWVSPIGPINVSLAQGIDAPGKPILLQFSMGPDL